MTHSESRLLTASALNNYGTSLYQQSWSHGLLVLRRTRHFLLWQCRDHWPSLGKISRLPIYLQIGYHNKPLIRLTVNTLTGHIYTACCKKIDMWVRFSLTWYFGKIKAPCCISSNVNIFTLLLIYATTCCVLWWTQKLMASLPCVAVVQLIIKN